MENNDGSSNQESATNKNGSSPVVIKNNDSGRGASSLENNQAKPQNREPRPLIIWTAILAIGTVVLGCAAVWSDFLIRDQLIEMRKAGIDTKRLTENELSDFSQL